MAGELEAFGAMTPEDVRAWAELQPGKPKQGGKPTPEQLAELRAQKQELLRRQQGFLAALGERLGVEPAAVEAELCLRLRPAAPKKQAQQTTRKKEKEAERKQMLQESSEAAAQAAAALLEELLALPAPLQEQLAVMRAYPFSRADPAPTLEQPAAEGARLLATVEMDSFAAGAALSRAGLKPAVLNMANQYNCGGAWCNGRGSQEEHLFRSSSLPLSLWPYRRADDCRL